MSEENHPYDSITKIENTEHQININLNKYITINIDDTGQDDGIQNGNNTEETIEKDPEPKPRHVGNDDGKATSRNPVTWVYFQMSDAAKNQIEPTGEPLDYDPQTRNGFVRLVFMLVFIMLMLTFGFTMLVRFVELLEDVFTDKVISLCLLIAGMVIMLAMNYVMFCSECSRRPPCNYICLVIVTIAMSLVVAVVTVRYKLLVILLAVGITAAVTLLCLALACTRFDFTKYLLYFVVIAFAFSLIAFVVLLLMKVFNMYFKPVHIAILCISVLISTVGLIMELQMILGGKTEELGEDDYALGAFMLYTSIIQMFLQILQLLDLLGVKF